MTDADRLAKFADAFRRGFAPEATTEALVCLRDALRNNAKDLIHGNSYETSLEHEDLYGSDALVTSTCLMCYAEWKSGQTKAVHEVNAAFARTTFHVDLNLGQPAGCRWICTGWDELPRDQVRALALELVEETLAARQKAVTL